MLDYRLVATALLCSFVSTPVLAQDAAPVKPAKEKKICRSEVSTGSIMPRSTCHTKAEWQAIDQQNQADASQFEQQRQRAGGGPRP